MHTTANSAERTAPSSAPLRPRPDQAERWFAHQTPVPFDIAADQILDAHREDGPREDVVVHQLRTWAFCSSERRAMALMPVPFDGRLDGQPMLLRELAFSQLCTKIGAPSAYVRELPARLQLACVNLGVVRQEAPALLRLAGNEVRAIVSERYAAADDALILEILSEVFDRTGLRGSALVRAVAVGTHTVMRITLPSDGVAVRRGDVIEHGVDVANCELGLRSVQVTPVTYCVACTNGLRSWHSHASLRVRHVGEPKRLRDQLRDAIPVALAEARGDIERWKRSVDRLVDSALEEIEGLRRYGVHQSEVATIGQTFAAELGGQSKPLSDQSLVRALKVRTSAFDVANAITATARDRPTAARLGLEEVAHRYLLAAT